MLSLVGALSAALLTAVVVQALDVAPYRGASQRQRFGASFAQRSMRTSHAQQDDSGRHALQDSLDRATLISMNGYMLLTDLRDSAHIPLLNPQPAGVGERVAQELLAAEKPQVVYMQRTAESFNNFLAAMEASAANLHSTGGPPPFVLVAVNGDPPMTREMQLRIAQLPGLRACFATEMAPDAGTGVFYPLPLGMNYHGIGNYEGAIENVRKTVLLEMSTDSAVASRQAMRISDTIRKVRVGAKKFEQRIPKLLIPPMGKTNDFRREWFEVLAQPEYKDLVHFSKTDFVAAHRKEPIEKFLRRLAEYQAVLSPPGVSYDCFRTWEILGVGSVPALQRSDAWNMKLYADVGLEQSLLPEPRLLTPAILRSFLQGLRDPEDRHKYLTAEYWHQQWRSKLP